MSSSSDSVQSKAISDNLISPSFPNANQQVNVVINIADHHEHVRDFVEYKSSSLKRALSLCNEEESETFQGLSKMRKYDETQVKSDEELKKSNEELGKQVATLQKSVDHWRQQTTKFTILLTTSLFKPHNKETQRWVKAFYTKDKATFIREDLPNLDKVTEFASKFCIEINQQSSACEKKEAVYERFKQLIFEMALMDNVDKEDLQKAAQYARFQSPSKQSRRNCTN